VEAVSTSLFSRNLSVVDDGVELTRIEFRWRREGARFTVYGHTYEMQREDFFRGTLALRSEGMVVATARREGVFRSRILIDYAGRSAALRPVAWYSRQFSVLVDDIEVGRIKPIGWCRQRVIVDISNEIPVEVQVFLLCVAVVLWQRAAAAAT